MRFIPPAVGEDLLNLGYRIRCQFIGRTLHADPAVIICFKEPVHTRIENRGDPGRTCPQDRHIFNCFNADLFGRLLSRIGLEMEHEPRWLAVLHGEIFDQPPDETAYRSHPQAARDLFQVYLAERDVPTERAASGEQVVAEDIACFNLSTEDEGQDLSACFPLSPFGRDGSQGAID